MRADYLVKNNQKTVGFIVDKKYVKYYDALKNIEFIDNLVVNKAQVIRSKRGKLKEISIQEVNKKIYQKLVKENSLVRDIEKEFEEWKINFSDYVLYVSGARQTGKTTELLKFAYKNYEQIIYVNLANEREKETFKKLVLTNTVVFGMMSYCKEMQLEEYTDTNRTILIIDEIQESQEVYNSIRALQKELNCNIAVTGSYLGKTLNTKYFKPAGNTKDVEMLPLSFKEFCRANNCETLLDKINPFGTSSQKEYEKLTALYKDYIEIGGYPAVVKQYVKSKDIKLCKAIIESLINRFTEESAAYFKEDKSLAVFENVYKAAFISMSTEKKGTSSKSTDIITNFVINDTKEHVSRKEVNTVIAWLEYSKIIGNCDLLSNRRMYFMDCGIANSIASKIAISNETVRVLIAETFVYDELYRLYKLGKFKGDKPSCSVYNNYELDFFVVDKEDRKYGIEVKSMRSTKHLSLDYFKDNKLIDEGYLAEISRGGKSGINKIPIYLIYRFPFKGEENANNR